MNRFSVLTIAVLLTTTMVNVDGLLSSQPQFPEHLLTFSKAMDDIYHGQGGIRESRCDYRHPRTCPTNVVEDVTTCCDYFRHANESTHGCHNGQIWCGTTDHVIKFLKILSDARLL